MQYTVYVWMFLVVVAPILNYWVIIERMHTVDLVIHEKPIGRQFKNPDEMVNLLDLSV